MGLFWSSPLESRNSTVLRWPSQAATISRVLPCLSLTLISAPCCSSCSAIWKPGPKPLLMKRSPKSAISSLSWTPGRHCQQKCGTGLWNTDETAHLPMPLSDGTEQRRDPPPVDLLHHRALLQQEIAHFHLPTARRRRQGYRKERQTNNVVRGIGGGERWVKVLLQALWGSERWMTRLVNNTTLQNNPSVRGQLKAWRWLEFALTASKTQANGCWLLSLERETLMWCLLSSSGSSLSLSNIL